MLVLTTEKLGRGFSDIERNIQYHPQTFFQTGKNIKIANPFEILMSGARWLFYFAKLKVEKNFKENPPLQILTQT